MPFPSNATTAGAVFNKLRKKAKAQGRGTDELLIFYVLERFLYRLAQSPLATRFVLKGGLLLAVLDARRPTRDADLLAEFSRDQADVLAALRDITAIPVDDGVEFSGHQAHTQPIRVGDLYEGIRVTIPATVATAKVQLSLDINFGDPVTPGVVDTSYPQMLSPESFVIQAYPIETVLAEKLSTAVALGDANTRDRDYADLWRLTGLHEVDSETVRRALERTASHRGIQLRPLSEVLTTLAGRRASSFLVWRRHQGPDGQAYPDSIADVIRDVITFADPLLGDQVDSQRWIPGERQWQAHN